MKRYVVAAVFAGVALVAFAALAASLGGITSTGVGADSVAVASCDTDGITTSYTVAYDATDSRNEITAVDVASVDAACDGKSLTVTLTNSSGGVLDTSTTTVLTGGTTTVTVGSPPDAELVENVHVVING